MGNDRIRIAQRVEVDWQLLGAEERELVRRAFAHIDEDPISGAPLFHPFRGLWSYVAAERLRIVYRIFPEARYVLVMKIAALEEKR